MVTLPEFYGLQVLGISRQPCFANVDIRRQHTSKIPALPPIWLPKLMCQYHRIQSSIHPYPTALFIQHMATLPVIRSQNHILTKLNNSPEYQVTKWQQHKRLQGGALLRQYLQETHQCDQNNEKLGPSAAQAKGTHHSRPRTTLTVHFRLHFAKKGGNQTV